MGMIPIRFLRNHSRNTGVEADQRSKQVENGYEHRDGGEYFNISLALIHVCIIITLVHVVVTFSLFDIGILTLLTHRLATATYRSFLHVIPKRSKCNPVVEKRGVPDSKNGTRHHDFSFLFCRLSSVLFFLIFPKTETK